MNNEQIFNQNIQKLSSIYSKASTLSTTLSANFFTIPSMMSLSEQNLLYLLAKDYFTGEGAIFDAGCHLGGSTECFAKGLADANYSKNEVIHSYDLAIATDDYIIDFINFKCNAGLKLQDSFEHLLRDNLQNCTGNEYIKLYIGDILEQEYPSKIEIMFLDVCKSPLINHTMTQLFERCIPGKSVIVQQDFIYSGLPFLNITMGYFSDYFELISGDAITSTLVWLYKKEIPKTLLQKDLWSELSLDEMLNCFAVYDDKLNFRERIIVELNKVILFARRGNKQAAKSHLNLVECIYKTIPKYENSKLFDNTIKLLQPYNNTLIKKYFEQIIK